MYEVIEISKHPTFREIILLINGRVSVYRHFVDARDPDWVSDSGSGLPPYLLLEELFAKAKATYGSNLKVKYWRIDVLQKARTAMSKFTVGDRVHLRNGQAASVTALGQFHMRVGARVHDLDGVYILSKATDPTVAAYAAQFDIVGILNEACPVLEQAPQWPLIKFVSQLDVPNKPFLVQRGRIMDAVYLKRGRVIDVVYLNQVPVGLIVKSASLGLEPWFLYHEDLTGGLPEKLPRWLGAHSVGPKILESESFVGIKRKITNRLRKIVNIAKK